MKYTKEQTDQLISMYAEGKTVPEICEVLSVPSKSVIAKLSCMGLYKKKQYMTKRGEVPVKKEAYIEQLAKLLEVDVESLESLEKCTKPILALLVKKLQTAPNIFTDAE